MARNMSFMLTTEQIRNRKKTVTRRLGWQGLKAGVVLNACVKCMGLKKGEKIERLAEIRVVDVRRERLCEITADDVIREGFEGKSVAWFVDMFMREMGVSADAEVTRIEFEYVVNDGGGMVDELLRLPVEQQETMARILNGLIRLAEFPCEHLEQVLWRLSSAHDDQVDAISAAIQMFAEMEVGDGEDVDAEQD